MQQKKLPSNYKRPSREAFIAAGYTGNYEEFFERHEEKLAEHFDGAPMPQVHGVPDFLFIHSEVRSVTNRTVRARNPTRHRFKQYLFGDPSKRLIRNRPLRVPTEVVLANLSELMAKESCGMLSVRTADGRRLNLSALTQSTPRAPVLEPPRPSAPPPHPPLDSIANDAPAGIPMPEFEEGTYVGDPAAQRALESIVAEKRDEAERHGALDPADEHVVEDPAEPPEALAEETASAEEVVEEAVEETATPDPAAPRENKKHRKGRR